ncbi:hypothetical protein [Okeania sp. KiyG1]|uniref:hypothetical protein n=1 Tax=Okeania sp. KiyG1 TaxID=2720165 RepID=UPI0019235838|nr:hypothetical protein [Okeania sp. KiyG1]
MYSKGKEEGRGKKEEGRRKREEEGRLPSQEKTIISCRYSPLGLHKRYKRT